MKKTRFKLLEVMLSEKEFVIGEGFSEYSYTRAVVYVLDNGVIYTPDDPKYEPILQLNISEIEEEFDDDDIVNEICDIVDLMFKYQNHFYIDFYIPEDDDEYDDDCNDYYDE